MVLEDTGGAISSIQGLTIKLIEDEYFDGNKISAASTNHSDNVMSYLQANLEKIYLLSSLSWWNLRLRTQSLVFQIPSF